MKIRTSFVSNSSSTSFLIKLPGENHKHTTEELLNYLGLDKEDVLNSYPSFSNGIKAERAVTFLQGMLDNKNALTRREIKKWFRNATYYSADYGWLTKPTCSIKLQEEYITLVKKQDTQINEAEDALELYKQHDKERSKLENKIATEWMNNWFKENDITFLGNYNYNNKIKIYSLCHEDHGEFGELETGSLYKNIPHVKISNH